MSWVVDTSVLIDVLDGDPEFGLASAALLEERVDSGLTVCPVTYVELAPAFEGDLALQDRFLEGVGVSAHEPWTWADTLAAHAAWNAFILRRRQGGLPRRPLADLLIGAFALRFEGLVTRNGADFAALFPELPRAIPSPSPEQT